MIWVLAVLTMIVDHVGALLYGDALAWRLVGRISFPLFAWGVSEGIRRTGNVEAYLWRLAFLSVPSEAVHYWVFGYGLSPVTMLLVGAVLSTLPDYARRTALLVGLLPGVTPWVLPVAWSYPSPLPIVALLLSSVLDSWPQVGSLVAVPVVYLLRDLPQPGVPRWAKYAVYPVHLLLLGMINRVWGG